MSVRRQGVQEVAAFARCANSKCGIVLNLDRFPEGTPCHKCGERRRVPLPEVAPHHAPPSRARGNWTRLLIVALAAVAVAVAGGAAVWLLSPSFLKPEQETAPVVPEPAPKPAESPATPLPQPAPIPTPAPAPAAATAEPAPPATARQGPTRSYTRFDLAIGEDEFMYRVNPAGGETKIQRNDGADVRIDAASHAMTLVYDKPYEKYKGAIYHWKGRKEVLLPANDQIASSLVCDVVGGKVYALPLEATVQKTAVYEVDMKAMAPVEGASLRILVSLDVGFYHLLYVLVSLPANDIPLLAGYGYTGQRLPTK